MMQRRWWQADSHPVDDEIAWFEEANLDFALDENYLEEKGVVLFRGALRLGDRRVEATVEYPLSYDAGGHPMVIAPELPVERHRGPGGELCLDHPVLGKSHPMCGAEAVERAERLWHLWENDRPQLRVEEADAPDPAANYYEYVPEAAISIAGMDVSGGTEGYFRLQATRIQIPLRAVVTEVRVVKPELKTLDPMPPIEALEGPYEINGAWKRVDSPPPWTLDELRPWLEENHRAFADRQFKFGKQQARAAKTPDMPAVFAFVYPNEGPERDKFHDAWLFCVVEPLTGNGYVARSFPLRDDERWLRQPQLQPLEERRVTVVGVGALGSQIAHLLAQAGVGHLTLVDHDRLTHGNRIRHDLDLRDVGRAKVSAVGSRLRATNPWCTVETVPTRVGAAVFDNGGRLMDDVVFEQIAASDLLINSSAHPSTGRHLSRMAFDSDVAAIHAWVSAGAWGGRTLIQRPNVSGCVECFGLAQEEPGRYEEAVEVPVVSADPEVREVSEHGCADTTFTGPGFELAEAAAATARVAVQELLGDGDRYPTPGFDLATLTFRDATAATLDARYTRLPVHPDCSVCSQP